jgi:hypothetical protein
MKSKFNRLGTFAAAALLCTGAAPLLATPAQASPAIMVATSVVLSSEAMIERQEIGADGKERVVLKQPKDVIVVPGDRVVFTLRYVNKGAEPAAGFRATNPMPAPVQFVSVAEDWADVSVDGGATWGKLADLKVSVKQSDGSAPVVRAAAPEDVTHVRWVFASAIAPGAEGSVSYRGLVK